MSKVSWQAFRNSEFYSQKEVITHKNQAHKMSRAEFEIAVDNHDHQKMQEALASGVNPHRRMWKSQQTYLAVLLSDLSSGDCHNYDACKNLVLNMLKDERVDVTHKMRLGSVEHLPSGFQKDDLLVGKHLETVLKIFHWGDDLMAYAVNTGDIEIVRAMAEVYKEQGVANPNVRNHFGATPIFWATTFNDVDYFKDVLKTFEQFEDFEFDVDEGVKVLGDTLIHIATFYGAHDVIQYLYENYDANLTLRNSKGRSPYLMAAMTGRVEIIKYFHQLESAPRNQNPQFDFEEMDDEGGYSALHLAAMYGQSEVVAYLLSENLVDSKVLDANGNSAYDLIGTSLSESSQARKQDELNLLRELLD